MSDPFTEHLTEIASGLQKSMSLREGSRARTSASPETAEDSTESEAAFGGSLHGSFAHFDLDTWSWKTSQLSLIGDSTLSSDGLPRTGMMRSGRLYPQRRWVPRTLESDCSWWPTPAAWDATDREVPGDAYVTKTGTVRAKYGDDHSSNLGLQGTVKGRELLPTPAAADAERKSETYYRGEGNPTLLGAARKLERWPTPQARDGDHRGAQGKRFLNPERSNDLPDAVDHVEEKSGSLNPTWVAWLMGFPTGWPALED